MPSKPVLWKELTWEQITQLRDRGIDLVILPIGATEQHALHLSVGVDTFSATAVARWINQRSGQALFLSDLKRWLQLL